MAKNEFGRREREFIKGFCKRTFGYFTPHFYRLLLIIGLLLLFLVWFSKNYALSYTEDIEGIEALPKIEMEAVPGDTTIQSYCATDESCREHRWNEIKEVYFNDKTFINKDKDSWLLTPKRAPDGAFVPISFGTHRKNVKFAHLVIDMNPVPSIALGSSEVKPIEIISAYSAVANLGTYLNRGLGNTDSSLAFGTPTATLEFTDESVATNAAKSIDFD